MAKQPMDHLRGKKKPVRKTVWVAGDSELADELSELEERLSRAEASFNLQRDESPRREALQREVDELTIKRNAVKEQVRETAIKFVFQAIPRKKYEALIEEHPPTDKQVADWKASGEKGSIDFNPDTFPVPLIVACCIEPDVDKEELADWLQNGEEWNQAELVTLFMAATEVNQTRRIVNLGKD